MTFDSVMRSEKKLSQKANTFYDYVNSHERSRRDNSVGRDRSDFLGAVGEGKGVIGW